MGFYIQDEYWEAVEDLPVREQDAFFGACVRQFFLGDTEDPKPKNAKRVFKVTKARISTAKKRSSSANARWDANADALHDAKVDANADASLLKSERESESKNKSLPKKGRPRFNPPTFDEAEAYRAEAGLDHVDTRHFLDHYESNGWVQGRGKPIKDWRACMRNWNRNQLKWDSERRGGHVDHGEYAGAF